MSTPSFPSDGAAPETQPPRADGDEAASELPQTTPPAEASAMAETPRPSVPGYEIVDQGKSGGMGTVFKARNPRLEAFVAIKIPHERVLDSPDCKQRFLNEARNAAQLQHANICRTFDVNETAGTPYLVMEYIDGVNLVQWRSAAPRSMADYARVLAAVCRAVHFAHEHDIIHRDIKPQNVLVKRDGQPVLTDFGLAKSLVPRAAGDELTGEMQILGTLAYMAPEQTTGSKHAGPQSDVYALGAVLYFLLVGEAPFRFHKDEDLFTRVRRVQTEEPTISATPTELERICKKTMAKAPAERYESALALAEALERFCEGVQTRPAAQPRRWPWLAALATMSLLVGLCIVLRPAWLVEPSSIDKTPHADHKPNGNPPQSKFVDLNLAPGGIRILKGHQGNVKSVAFCPDGIHALSGSSDKTIRLWDLRTGKELHKFVGHGAGLQHVAVSPDGDFALSCGDDGTVILWNIRNRVKLRDFQAHKRKAQSVAFSSDGERAVSAAVDGLIVWDVALMRRVPKSECDLDLSDCAAGQEIVKRIENREPSAMVAKFFPDGRNLLAASLLAPTLFMFDATTGEELAAHNLKPHSISDKKKVWLLWNVALSPDGNYAAAAVTELVLLRVNKDRDGKFSFQELHRFNNETRQFTSVDFSRTGNLLLSGSIEDKRVQLWRWDDKSAVRLASHQHDERVWSVCFSPDGAHALSGSGAPAKSGQDAAVDCTLRLWRLPN